VRASDIVCRYGGEEFTVILPDSSPEIARERAEQIRVNMSKITLKHSGQDLGKVTLSLGVSTYPQSGMTRDELIKNADIALYRAKENGRNQVVMYE
jgi:diguanylate cyclase (GGDEF)-like protein